MVLKVKTTKRPASQVKRGAVVYVGGRPSVFTGVLHEGIVSVHDKLTNKARYLEPGTLLEVPYKTRKRKPRKAKKILLWKPSTATNPRKVQGVYLIHFKQPYKHALHYIGYADDLAARFAEHAKGKGSRLLEVLKMNGIDFEIVRVWKGKTRTFERQLKNRKNASKLCPICQRKH
jgi:predicted GIY-YIG superfamily endonuclease